MRIGTAVIIVWLVIGLTWLALHQAGTGTGWSVPSRRRRR